MRKPTKFAKSTEDGGTKKNGVGTKNLKVTKAGKPDYVMSHEVVESFCEQLNITEEPMRLDILLESGQPVVVSMDYMPRHDEEKENKTPMGFGSVINKDEEEEIEEEQGEDGEEPLEEIA